MQRYHLTIVIVISASRHRQHLPDPPTDATLPLRGDKEGDGGRNKKKKKHIYWRLWQQRVKSFGLLSYSVPAPGCGWCYFWRGRGKASATCCSAGCRCQGVVCVWVTDWLTVPVPGYSKLHIFFCVPFCSPDSTLFQLSCFPCDCSRFVAFRGQLQFVVFEILVCFWVGFGFWLGWVGLGWLCASFGVSWSWHCTGTTTTTRAGKTSK